MKLSKQRAKRTRQAFRVARNATQDNWMCEMQELKELLRSMTKDLAAIRKLEESNSAAFIPVTTQKPSL